MIRLAFILGKQQVRHAHLLLPLPVVDNIMLLKISFPSQNMILSLGYYFSSHFESQRSLLVRI